MSWEAHGKRCLSLGNYLTLLTCSLCFLFLTQQGRQRLRVSGETVVVGASLPESTFLHSRDFSQQHQPHGDFSGVPTVATFAGRLVVLCAEYHTQEEEKPAESPWGQEMVGNGENFTFSANPLA